MPKAWPEDGSTVAFTDLVDPLIRAFNDGATWKPRASVVTEDIGWTGPSKCSAGDVRPEDHLSVSGREYDRERGRSFLVTILSLAITLGIEQGQRVERERQDTQRKMLRLGLKIQEDALAQLEVDRNGRDV